MRDQGAQGSAEVRHGFSSAHSSCLRFPSPVWRLPFRKPGCAAWPTASSRSCTRSR
jgi:hypothetical protein